MKILLCLGMLWWLNPTFHLPEGIPICEYDRQEIVTHLLISDARDGPWRPFCDVLYGQQMWVGTVPAAKWFYGYATLYGTPSNWSGPVYSGDAPAPAPLPPPTKPGKGKGRLK